MIGVAYKLPAAALAATAAALAVTLRGGRRSLVRGQANNQGKSPADPPFQRRAYRLDFLPPRGRRRAPPPLVRRLVPSSDDPEDSDASMEVYAGCAMTLSLEFSIDRPRKLRRRLRVFMGMIKVAEETYELGDLGAGVHTAIFPPKTRIPAFARGRTFRYVETIEAEGDESPLHTTTRRMRVVRCP